MCDHTLVEKMKQYQVGPASLECNPGPNCWCAQISYVFPIIGDRCMTPTEILQNEYSDLSDVDKQYLTSIMNREVKF